MAKTLHAEADLLHGPVLQNMLRFALPILAGTLLQQLYSMVDAVVVGQFVGKTALAAVGGSAVAIINLLLNFFVGLCSGAAIVVAQYYGAHDHENVSRAVHTAALLAVWVGAVMTVIGVCFAPGFLTALDTPEDTMQYSIDYMRWYFAGMIPTMIYNMGSSILRAMGDSKRPLYFLLLCTGVNTVLDLLCVAVLRLEVAGAAIATSLSQLICAGLVIWVLLRIPGDCRLRLPELRFDSVLLRRAGACEADAPARAARGIAERALQRHEPLRAEGRQPDGHGHGRRVVDLCEDRRRLLADLECLRHRDHDLRRPELRRAQPRPDSGVDPHRLAAASGHGGVLLGVLSSPLTMRLFSSDPAVLAEARQFILHISSCYVLFSSVEVLSSAMRGVGNAVKPAVITFFAVCVLRMALLFTVTFPHLSVLTISICYPITWAASSVLFILYYKFGRWMPLYPESAKSE